MPSENKILIVDDEENIRWVFAQALEEKPLTVHTAANAEEALERMTETITCSSSPISLCLGWAAWTCWIISKASNHKLTSSS